MYMYCVGSEESYKHESFYIQKQENWTNDVSQFFLEWNY